MHSTSGLSSIHLSRPNNPRDESIAYLVLSVGFSQLRKCTTYREHSFCRIHAVLLPHFADMILE